MFYRIVSVKQFFLLSSFPPTRTPPPLPPRGRVGLRWGAAAGPSNLPMFLTPPPPAASNIAGQSPSIAAAVDFPHLLARHGGAFSRQRRDLTAARFCGAAAPAPASTAAVPLDNGNQQILVVDLCRERGGGL
jgi:hypothetical protein